MLRVGVPVMASSTRLQCRVNVMNHSQDSTVKKQYTTRIVPPSPSAVVTVLATTRQTHATARRGSRERTATKSRAALATAPDMASVWELEPTLPATVAWPGVDPTAVFRGVL